MQSKQPFLLGLSNVVESPLYKTHDLYDSVGHNTGNVAFHEGVRKIVVDNLPTVSWFASPERIDAAGDIGIIPAANQFGPHANFGNLAQRFAKLKARLVMVGLGAQSSIDGQIPEVPEGTVHWVKEVISRSPSGAANIAVRGSFTKKVLDHYGLGDSAVVCGCPSLFINPVSNLGEQIEARLGLVKSIAVAAGHQKWKHLGKIEATLVNLARKTNGSYVGSSPFEMVALTRGEANYLPEADLIACRDYACPDMDLSEFVSWSRSVGRVFFDVWSWMEHYRHYDLVVGARIHGVMLALQAGVPGLCIAHDSRTLELCQTMLIPHITPRELGHNFNLDRIVDAAKIDGVAFDKNRRELAKRFREFFVGNEIAAKI